jgi:hypothetical protein
MPGGQRLVDEHGFGRRKRIAHDDAIFMAAPCQQEEGGQTRQGSQCASVHGFNSRGFRDRYIDRHGVAATS